MLRHHGYRLRKQHRPEQAQSVRCRSSNATLLVGSASDETRSQDQFRVNPSLLSHAGETSHSRTADSKLTALGYFASQICSGLRLLLGRLVLWQRVHEHADRSPLSDGSSSEVRRGQHDRPRCAPRAMNSLENGQRGEQSSQAEKVSAFPSPVKGRGPGGGVSGARIDETDRRSSHRQVQSKALISRVRFVSGSRTLFQSLPTSLRYRHQATMTQHPQTH